MINNYPTKEKAFMCLDLLFSKGGTNKDLARHLDCSLRTANRTIELLKNMNHEFMGIEIYSVPAFPKGKRYFARTKM